MRGAVAVAVAVIVMCVPLVRVGRPGPAIASLGYQVQPLECPELRALHQGQLLKQLWKEATNAKQDERVQERERVFKRGDVMV